MLIPLLPGCDSSSPDPPPATEVTVQAVEIEEVAFQAPDGSPWDARSGPDFFYTLTGPAGEEVIRSGAVEDVAPSDLPILPSGSATIDVESGPYTLTVFEEDIVGREEDASTQEVGRVSFAPSDHAEGRPPEVTIREGTERLTLRTVWRK